ncbi:glycosyltransferase, partial [Nostoc sp. NIES-2111]
RLFSGFTVGFIGSLYAWAGLDFLLIAIAELRREDLDISLVIVGDGAMEAEWKKQSQELGIESHVAFLGRVPWQDIPQYIAGFDVGYSGQVQLQMGKMYLSPMKLYEYMGMAKPVIASAFEDAKRLICDRQTGFLFNSGDADDLKRTLSEAYQKRASLPEMGRLARMEIVKNHSWTARVEHLITGAEKILEKQRAAMLDRTRSHIH